MLGFNFVVNNSFDFINKIDQFGSIQLFLGEPNKPKYEKYNLKDIELLKSVKKERSIKIFIHSKFCYNISKNNIFFPIREELLFLKSINEYDTGIVIHLSKYYKTSREKALEDVVLKLNMIISKFKSIFYGNDILIETTHVFQHLGSTIEDLAFIINNVKSNIGICIDTSHLFLSGYLINTPEGILHYFLEFSKQISLNYIKLFHLNDIDSKPFETHTKHLSPFDERGKIFRIPLTLDIVMSLIKVFKIPTILEIPLTEKNLIDFNKLKEYKPKLGFNIVLILKNLLLLDFLELLISYCTVMYDPYKEYIKSLEEIKYHIINSYNINNKLIYDTNKLKKTSDNKYLYNIFHKKLNIPKYIYEDLILLLNDYSYNIFLKYQNNPKYVDIINLTKVHSIGIITAKELYNKNIKTIKDLYSTKFEDLEQILTSHQLKCVKLFKFINVPLTINIAFKIINILQSNNSNFKYEILGSFFRLTKYMKQEESVENNNLIINDIDCLLCVETTQEKDKFISFLKKIFIFKGFFYEGKSNLSMVLKIRQNKSVYFIFDLFITNKKEYIFNKIYLSHSKEENIQLRRLASISGYKLSNKNLINKQTKKEIEIKSEEELYQLINL